ncbi:hypothetical protein NN561_011446 [Cricetulus griseus]
MCPLVVSGDIFDLSGFCGNPGVAQGPSVASISAYYQEQGMMYVFVDVSCNEITALPQQIGQLKSLRELNVRRNYLKVLPPELVDLPLVKFDFSCNKVLVIPICFREMKQLQVLLLENNPLQSPPAQPSDEDTVSLNVPMSNIMEEEQTIKEDACHHLTPAKGEFQPKPSLLGDTNSSGQERDQFADGVDALHPGFMNYIKVQNDLMIQSNGSQYSPNEMRDSSPSVSPTANITAPFGLKPRSVFVRPQRNLESIDPQFTIRRKMEQMREEKELVEQLRESIEMRLKVTLHEDLGAALMDGVVLCHLANHIRPRSVASIHVPSPAVADLCSPYDILQLDFRHIRKTVDTLLALGEKPPQPTSALRSRDLIGFCLVHVLFIVLVYITYRWNALSA